MIIGDRLRELREKKDLSQGDVETRSGLLRCYVSRVENGHTVPSIETLEKLARALECPLYQLFYDGDAAPEVPAWFGDAASKKDVWGSDRKDVQFVEKLRKLLAKCNDKDRKMIMQMAQQLTQR
ncbi:MAG TPA: helix-turn-helix transcriptional regulator [Candidatus Acidoferrum sp.]|jgi:transcriptional regulator with XRE-family HTH domain